LEVAVADYYLQFSATLDHLTKPQAEWLASQLEKVYVIDDRELSEDELPPGKSPQDAQWSGCRGYRNWGGYTPECGDDVGFEYQFSEPESDHDRHLWLYSEDHAELERVAHIVQKFLKTFRPNDSWSMTYASTCSKPRIGEFSGGALFVTASRVRFFNAGDFIEHQLARFERQARRQ
jgi:hypothetical protein